MSKSTILFYITVSLILIHMVNSTNHVNNLLLFFLSTLVYYTYCYLINCNWVRLIILLWYARRITVLFYLLACYNSSLSYSNVYSNKRIYLWFQHFNLFNSQSQHKKWYFTRLVVLIYLKLQTKLIVFTKYTLIGSVSNNIKQVTKKMYHYNTNKGNIVNSLEIQQQYYNKPVYFKYTNFVDIYSALIANPSCLFLVLFLLPLFAYLIYFVCNFLSFRIKSKL